MDRRLYWIWLQQAIKPGNSHIDALLRCFGDVRGIYDAYSGDFSGLPLSRAELDGLSDHSMDRARYILRTTLDMGGWLLTPEDQRFPSLLKSISDMPAVLYGMGEMPDLDMIPSIAVIGTRKISRQGIQITAMISAGLAAGGAVVVSGGADGGDAVAHNMAMEFGGITVAVQACGLDINYPAVNREMRNEIIKKGAVLSEYAPGNPAYRHHFRVRNRIMSGMTIGTCVTEAPEKSGTMITAHHAFEQGRDVFAVAGDALTGRSAGTDILIRDGARLVRGADEILEEYGERFRSLLNIEEAARVKNDPRFRRGIVRDESPASEAPLPKPPKLKIADETNLPVSVPDFSPDFEPSTLSGDVKIVYESMDTENVQADAIIVRSGLDARRVMTALTTLELMGGAVAGPGQTYRRKG